MAEQIQTSFKRIEKKYLLTPQQREQIILGCRPYMVPDQYEHYQSCSIYYDTEDYALIRASIEKPVYKEKLRVRSYGVPTDSDRVFVEIKKKYDKVVYKRRIIMRADASESYLRGETGYQTGGQIGHEIEWFQKFHRAKPRVFIGYDRHAFAGIEQPDLRITFDTNIRWRGTDLDLRSGMHGERILPEDTVLMEVKIPGAAPLWLASLLSKVGAFPSSFSKYGNCYKYFILKDLTKRKEIFTHA